MTDGNPKHHSTSTTSSAHKGVRRQIPDWERKFQCPHPLCGKRFTRKFSMTEHIKTHTGDKPHECSVPGCGKKFTTAGNLARHRKIHDGYKDEKNGGDESPSSSTSSSSHRRPETIYERKPTTNSDRPAHHPTAEFPTAPQTLSSSGPTPPKPWSGKRRFSVPTTGLDFQSQYKAPAHLLNQSNNNDVFFDDALQHRAKLDAIRQFETSDEKLHYFDPYPSQSSSSQSWMPPSQSHHLGGGSSHQHPQHMPPSHAHHHHLHQHHNHQSPFQTSSHDYKQTRSQSLNHHQLASQLQAMHAGFGYSKFLDSGNNQRSAAQPETDVDFLLQEDEEDNQAVKQATDYGGGSYSTKSEPYSTGLLAPTIEFAAGYPISDPFFDDENSIIDMLFDDRAEVQSFPQTSATPSFGARLGDEWNKQPPVKQELLGQRQSAN
ncbi:Aste57867_13753 [Aphanomyces stellatus]|uniref:Aste57867_13753 protein n=1 Tax=Aphanomyces stellatus TaxID=120398 RepID=A0A485KZB0_9STRA|nr:hypothetical protein As57867_013703 [Aphanomyces stellatus]VFT90586.1 Aste57867_13753 [Aphanomyces stellatus]